MIVTTTTIDNGNCNDSHRVRKGKKGVRFDDDSNELIFVDSVIDVGEEGIVEKLWYQDWERKEHKRAIKRDAKEWRKTGLGILLHDTFVNPNPTQTQSCLNAFTQLADADYSRGIERYLSQPHDEQRVGRKRNFIQDVLEQARYLESLKHTMTADEKREKLAEFSALQSKCAEVFARRIGKADETAAQYGEDPSAAAKLVSKLYRSEIRRRSSVDAVLQTPSEPDVMKTHESSTTSRRSSFPFGSRPMYNAMRR